MENSQKKVSEITKFRTPRGVSVCNNVVADPAFLSWENNFMVDVFSRMLMLTMLELSERLPNHCFGYEVRCAEKNHCFDDVHDMVLWFCELETDNNIFAKSYELTISSYRRYGKELDYRKSTVYFTFKRERWENIDTNYVYKVPVMICESMVFPFMDNQEKAPVRKFIDNIKQDFELITKPRAKVLSR